MSNKQKSILQEKIDELNKMWGDIFYLEKQLSNKLAKYRNELTDIMNSLTIMQHTLFEDKEKTNE